MKKKINPTLKNISVTCATCRNKHEIYTTVNNIYIETCAYCHPFYTGNQNFTTVAGQVDKFNKRYKQIKPKE